MITQSDASVIIEDAVPTRSAELIHEWLAEGGSADALLDSLDELYRASERSILQPLGHEAVA